VKPLAVAVNISSASFGHKMSDYIVVKTDCYILSLFL